MGGSKSDVDALERHYRVILDFRLMARAITPEVCQESFFFNEGSASVGEPHFQENIERQRRLYALLRNNRQALEQYLLSVLTQEAGIFAYEGLADIFDVAEEDELLVPLYKGMEEEDAKFFEECQEMGALAENTDLIATAFKVECVGVEIEGISGRAVGDVKKAQAAQLKRQRLIRKMSS
jgi:hypothetical protein